MSSIESEQVNTFDRVAKSDRTTSERFDLCDRNRLNILPDSGSQSQTLFIEVFLYGILRMIM